jgi:protocatechuate 3,4-dioxygenase alpha subunit
MAASKKSLPESPSQTAGPYVHIGCLPNFSGIEGIYAEDPGTRILGTETPGERITISGCIYDADGAPLLDALVESWQADVNGVFASPADGRGPASAGFSGWGRVACDFDSGEFLFETVKPGAVPWPDGRPQAPHMTLWIVARGINIGLHTRLYFGDESAANAADPILASIEPRERAETLIATADGQGGYRFEIYLQGPRETVFFDI